MLLPNLAQGTNIDALPHKKESAAIIELLEEAWAPKSYIECHKVIQGQPRSEPWASIQESELQAQFGSGLGLNLFQLDCRNTMCEMAVTGQAQASDLIFGKYNALLSQGWPERSGLGLLQWFGGKHHTQYRVFLRFPLFPEYIRDRMNKAYLGVNEQYGRAGIESDAFSCRDWKAIESQYLRLRAQGIEP